MTEDKKLEILKNELNLTLDKETLKKLEIWQRCFLEYNSHTNLMSKNDVKFLFEKHVFDSLAIVKWEKWDRLKSSPSQKILDIGTGGGFPSVILAIFNPEITIFANDSRIKKINFVKIIKKELGLENLQILYSRIEEEKNLEANLIISRAVGKILDVYELAKKQINKKTSFLIYKSKLFEEEISDFKKKYPRANFSLTRYRLPLDEQYERVLVELTY